MASGLYESYKESCLDGTSPDLTAAGKVKMTLIDAADYAVDLAAHDFFDDVTAAGRVGVGTLDGVTVTNGVLDATDEIMVSVTGDQAEAVVLWWDSGVESTSPLIAYIDNSPNLPVTPNGADITFEFDTGANKIFKL